jgi:hypothetical protein
MPAANVPMVIDQGEDWTADVVWTDNFDEPMPVRHPCRMDIRNTAGAIILTLETDTDPPPGTIPSIQLSGDIGLLQLHIDNAVTEALIPGRYLYDLFASSDDGNVYAGNQITRLLFGEVTVNKRITQM